MGGKISNKQGIQQRNRLRNINEYEALLKASLKYKIKIIQYKRRILHCYQTPILPPLRNEAATLEDVLFCEPQRKVLPNNHHRNPDEDSSLISRELYLPISNISICHPRCLTKYNVYYGHSFHDVVVCSSRRSLFTNLSLKQYIKIGIECPICYEPIAFKAHAFLTECGHAFHHKCIQKYYDVDYNKIGDCPFCRQSIGYYEENIKFRYYFSLNCLDKLEDFWMNIDSIIPIKCFRCVKDKFIGVHNLGMKKDCEKCRLYRSKMSLKIRLLIYKNG